MTAGRVVLVPGGPRGLGCARGNPSAAAGVGGHELVDDPPAPAQETAMLWRSFLFLVVLVVLVVSATPALAEDALSYQMPPRILADMIDAPPTPGVAVSPDGEWLVLLERPGLPPISEVAMPELRLAGLRINPRTDGPSRARYLDGLTFQRLSDGEQIPVTGLPDGAQLTGVSWSPDGERIAFVVTHDEQLGLWYAELGDARARRVTPVGVALNGVYGRPYDWLRDSRSFVVRVVPADRGPAPAASHAPSGPVVQENLGQKAPARTLQDLLQNPHDEALFEHHATSQVHVVELDGDTRAIGTPGIVASMDPSPDGRYLLTETIHRPYSYSLQQDRFPTRIEVWDLRRGEVVHQVVDRPLQDQIPIAFGSVATGPRSVQWRSDEAAQLVWVEAL
ncbi:hypothetical protein GF314_05225, partial [bacterium]|nr:hypothetical protein [bacterium]